MANLREHKVVGSLPATLEPDSVYYVRVGAGLDVYVTNSTGTIVAVPLNTQISYEYRDIWAEESGAATNNNTQWSFGNGATGIIGLPVGNNWEVTEMYFQADSGGSAAESISVEMIDIQTGTPANVSTISVTGAGDGQDDNAHLITTYGTPITVPDGAVLGFRTVSEVGAYIDMRVGARLRRQL